MRINLCSNSSQNFSERERIACTPDLDILLGECPVLQAAWSSLPKKTVSKGESLVQIGQSIKQAWRVEQGLMRMYFLSGDGKECNRSFHADGQWIGAGVPPVQTESPYGMEALENTTLIELPYLTLQKLQQMDARVFTTLQNALGSVFMRQAKRESELLLLDAANRYQKFLDFYGPVTDRIPLHHVASYLGITNVALSRIRRQMKSDEK